LVVIPEGNLRFASRSPIVVIPEGNLRFASARVGLRLFCCHSRRESAFHPEPSTISIPQPSTISIPQPSIISIPQPSIISIPQRSEGICCFSHRRKRSGAFLFVIPEGNLRFASGYAYMGNALEGAEKPSTATFGD